MVWVPILCTVEDSRSGRAGGGLPAATAAERRAAETFGLECYAKITRFKPPHPDAGLGGRGKLLSCENLPWGVAPRNHPELLRYRSLLAA